MTEVAAGVVRYEEEYLLFLKEASNGFTFREFPGGKVEQNEEPLQAMLREFEEETGNTLEDCMEFLRKGDAYELETYRDSYEVHPYEVKLSEKIDVDCSEEHKGYEWKSRNVLESMAGNGLIGENSIKLIEEIEQRTYKS